MKKKHVFLFLKFSITLILFYGLFRHIDLHKIYSIVSHAKGSMLFFSFGLIALQFLISVVRWQTILRIIGGTQSHMSLLGIYWMGLFFGTFLPASVGGDAMRVWMLKKRGLAAKTVINSIILDRLFGLLALLVIVALFIPSLEQLIKQDAIIPLFYCPVVALLLGIIVLYHIPSLPFNWVNHSFLNVLFSFSSDIRIVCSSITNLLLLSTLVLVSWALQITSIYMLALGLHLEISLIDCFILIPPIFFLTSLPVSIGGWGVRESAMVFFLGIIGVSSSSSLALGILFGCLTILISAPGGLIWVAYRNHRLNGV